jgi:hypothetical protein
MSTLSTVRTALRLLRVFVVLGMVLGLLTPLFQATPTYASTVSSAVFTGGAGTASVAGTLYAKNGGALTLTVTTSSDTQCVDVAGALSGHQQSSTATSSWTFHFTAGGGNGVQAVTVAVSSNFNEQQSKCTGNTASTQVSYTLDNTGPVMTGALSPAPNAAGWNKADATVNFSCSDSGSGIATCVADGTSPASASKTISTETNGTLVSGTASDAVGNSNSGSVTVRLDKTRPTITYSSTSDPTTGVMTVTFTCTDNGPSASGIKSCTGPTVLQIGQSVTGTAIDNADNSVSTLLITNNNNPDKTPPTISHSVSPAPNTAGWNKADATVTFSCSDSGSGIATCVADGTSPASASKTISTETNGTLVSGTATDKAGNTATDAATVKLDKSAPTITGSRAPAANANVWNNSDVTVSFACTDDGPSGIKSCSGPTTLSTSAPNQSASGAAVDNADNSASTTVSGINIDKEAPMLAGAPTTSPNTAGWYNGNVTIHWTASDTLSGLAGSVPADDTISSEGTALTASASVADKAGNTTNATSSPAVKIDKTAPTTGISGTSNNWVNGNVTVSLLATDNLSGIASTSYTIDGGTPQTGASFTLTTEGDHTVTFFSTDKAGNVESPQTAHIKIDKTAPTIQHSFTPLTYTNGAWTNQDVTVTFNCADQGGSGVASCTAPVTKSSEGEGQQVTGTATDGAGNSATDTAVVSIDKTAPTISAAPDRAPNSNLAANGKGWYNADVTVSFSASDALSGVASKSADKVLGEGANQGATGTATDAAGNSASASVSGINIDKTAPVLSGSFSSGWHTGDVTVNWTCTDALSGPVAQPPNDTVTGEGANLSSTVTCTDKAGNTAPNTVSGIQIDRTAPTTAASVPADPNNAGWYKAAVQITLNASDNLSGVGATYYSVDGGAAQTYNGTFSFGTEGTHTITFWSKDNAGNVEDKTGNSMTFKIDTTAPVVTGAATTAPNGNGWYTGDVTIHWTCSDATSGIAGTCPADSTISGEGSNLGASASVSDLAGNSTTRTISGIQIDRTAPTTSASVPDAPPSGWYKAAVQVTLTGHDALSDVDATYYSVDGGAAQTYNGAFSFGTEGTHTITFWSKDNAGNVETAGAPITLKIDKTAPTTTVINPISPDSGWFVTSGIPFAFDANDNASGIDATYYTIDSSAPKTYGEPFTANLSTGSHTVTYWSVDIAGNTEATQSLRLQVDTLPPTITGSQTPAKNSFGWNNTNVDVKFICTDADSGINGVAGCAGDTTLTNDGAGQMVPGDAVDVAGNRSSANYGPVNIDKTKPTLTGAATTNPNAFGWYKGNVTIHWAGQDGLSGIDPATQPTDSTITGEGSNLGAGPASISDKAGNVGTGSVGGIKIDRTAPTISGAATMSANAAGWYKSSVTVHFTCNDALSGVQECGNDVVLRSDGANQSASGTATDKADNSASTTKSGINIDSQAPKTDADLQCTGKNGYCRGNKATVVLTANDQAGLSGVKEIRYSTNNGSSWQSTAGASASVDVNLNGSGKASVLFYAVDNAGNSETQDGVNIKYDTIAPTVTHTLNPTANADGWNKADVTVHFDANDDSDGSGVDPSTVTTDQTISTETTGTVVNGSAEDYAGNLGTDLVTVKLDKTAPTIGTSVSGLQGSNGWYKGPVTIHFTCADPGAVQSGGVTCPADVVLSTDGTGQSASGTATDKAGNTASASVSGINIDSTKPSITVSGVADGGTYTLGAVPAPSCTASDTNGSGLDGTCAITVTGGKANGVGTFSFTATATDKAGNTSTQTGTYTVIYRWDGFLQPINDTAHQVGTSTSIFKAGSTVPTKFQLKKADGTVVQANSLPTWTNPVKGSPTAAPVDETAYTDPATPGGTYRWDSTAQQYIYNWGTAKNQVGYYWRASITLDDGQTYYVNIGLR